MSHYLSPVEFTRLFWNRTKNRDKIIEGFELMAKNIVTKYKNESHDAEDMISASILLCILKIDKFHVKSGTSAFSFFSSCIFNEIKQQHRSRMSYLKLKQQYANNTRYRNPPKVRPNASPSSKIIPPIGDKYDK